MPFKGYTSSKVCAAVLFLLLAAAGSLRATAIIVPGSAAAIEGDSVSPYPFDLTLVGVQSQRYQQVYSSSAFFGPLTITDIVFRPDFQSAAFFSSTLPAVRIDLSTTSAAVDGLSLTFADNVGADDAVVFGDASGSYAALSWSKVATTGPAAGPKVFDIPVHLTTPFFYDPANGNLLMDVRNAGGGTSTLFDAVGVTGDAVSSVFTVAGGSAAVLSPSASGASTGGLVTEFLSPTPIPEPASFAMLLCGCLALTALARRSGSPPQHQSHLQMSSVSLYSIHGSKRIHTIQDVYHASVLTAGCHRVVVGRSDGCAWNNRNS